MPNRARRWADAPRSARFTHFLALESALGVAINIMDCREQTATTQKLLKQWRGLLREQPPRE
jgi:hypothetical protein